MLDLRAQFTITAVPQWTSGCLQLQVTSNHTKYRSTRERSRTDLQLSQSTYDCYQCSVLTSKVTATKANNIRMIMPQQLYNMIGT